MVYDYKELLDMKNKGIKLDWNTITKEQLSHLFIDEGIINSMIADLYDVDGNKVRYKRSKWVFPFILVNIFINCLRMIIKTFLIC